MKKNIFSILILTLVTALFSILLATMFAGCVQELPDKSDNEDYLVDVAYSNDWRYVSIYLEGDAPPSATYNKTTRAMTTDTARRGFDYFEVFFYFKGYVYRSAWEIGKRASIMDVYRPKSPGIDYSLTSLYSGTAGGVAGNVPAGQSAVGIPTDGIPANAASVLFAGRKSDKTLLALGKLVSVDTEEPVENPEARNTYVKSDTVFVTFELFALTANTSADIEKSSFLTDNTGAGGTPSADNTRVISVLLGDKYFPLYMLPGGKSKISARYNLGIDGDWSDFKGSLLVMDKGQVEKRLARYPAGGGRYYYPLYPEDQTTLINMTNNQFTWNPQTGINNELQNPITFNINTTATVSSKKQDNGIFTFSFSIPVYAISSDIPKNSDDCWYIRTAYTSYYYNIDNGVTTGEFTDKNIGGAILCAVDLPAMNFEIPVERR